MDKKEKIILLATDKEKLREDMKGLLSRGGHTVLFAGTAEEGMEQAKKNPVDILILDMNTPAMNGYAFLESLLHDVVLEKVPTIFLLANNESDINEEKNATLNVKDYLVKQGATAADIGTKLLLHLGRANGSPLSAEGFKILVVEDDNFLRDLLARKLGQEDCQFIAAIDGENALRILNEDKPSIILLDLILPGIDGFEVLTKIKENPDVKNIPVVILSNLGQDSDIKRAKELGADDFLIKANFSIDEVITKIKELAGTK